MSLATVSWGGGRTALTNNGIHPRSSTARVFTSRINRSDCGDAQMFRPPNHACEIHSMLKFRLRTLLLVIAVVAFVTPQVYDWIRQRPVAIIGYSSAEIDEQLANGRPVLVLFTASWNLQSQAQLVAGADGAWGLVRDNRMTVINADCTMKGSRGERLMQQNGISSLPAFALYSPNDPLNPIVVRELATESNLRSALKQTMAMNMGGAMR